ncbi:MAG: endonuclease domain-containing protein [Pseudanabaena sp.]|jgi:very-short-patch-repair endonuclease
MNHIFNKAEYKPRRQALRSNMTEPEEKLWQILRGKQMGVKFRRQHGIGHYIADFYCPELKLVIEVDGDSHRSADAQAYDTVRHDFMVSLGIITLRFTNDEVMHNIEGIHQHLTQYLNTVEKSDNDKR